MLRYYDEHGVLHPTRVDPWSGYRSYSPDLLSMERRESWLWTTMIAQPPVVTADLVADAGLVRRGKHHEVYLGDPRRTAPDAMRTILRQPVSAG